MLRLVGRIALVLMLVCVAVTVASAQTPPAPQGPTVTVEGEVNTTGATLWKDGMTVAEAITAAKGMTRKGKLGHIKRPVKDADGKILRYEQVKELKPDTVLLEGDILVIARRWFSD